MEASGSDHDLMVIISIEELKNPLIDPCGTLMDPCGPLPPIVSCWSILKRLCRGHPKEDNTPSPYPTPNSPLSQIISVQQFKVLQSLCS